MRRILIASFVIALLACGLAALQPAAAQPDAKHPMHDAHAANATASAAASATPAAAPGLPTLAWHQVAGAEKEMVSLAEAMPADKYSWRPGEGVRSVGEVYMHVAGANYFLPTFWGIKIPQGIDPRSFEKDGGDKAKTVATLKASFEYLHQAIDKVTDADLGKPVDFFGRKAQVADIVLGAASHAHEHLGQAIAYARMNGVVPPWSVKQAQPGR